MTHEEGSGKKNFNYRKVSWEYEKQEKNKFMFFSTLFEVGTSTLENIFVTKMDCIATFCRTEFWFN